MVYELLSKALPMNSMNMVLYVTQIADTYDHAKTAAEKVKVVYDTQSVGSPILTSKEAVARDSTYPVHFLFGSELFPIGDAAKGLAEAEFQIEGEVHDRFCRLLCLWST